MMVSRYEDMVNQPEEWFRNVTTFLGVPPLDQPPPTDRKGRCKWNRMSILNKEQQNTRPDEKSHTAFFYPGAGKRYLKPETRRRLRRTCPSCPVAI